MVFFLYVLLKLIFMKKVFLLTLFTTILLATFAQDQSASAGMNMTKKMRWGVDVGVNLAKYDLDEEEFANPSLAPDVKNKTSFHAGVFLDIPLGGIVSLKPQIMYSRQGSNIEQRIASGTGTTIASYDEDLSYIYVAPVALHLLTRQGFIFETGPQLGYLVSAEQDGPAPYNQKNMRDARNKLDLLWSAGIGFLTKMGIGAHARYNYGFSNVLNNSGNTTPPGEFHNRVIQIGLMYHFGGHGATH